MLFEKVKEGDQVLIRKAKSIVSGGWGTQVNATVYLPMPVTRVTATQLTTAAGRFARRDGDQIGGNDRAYPVGHRLQEMGKDYILHATPPEHLAQLDYLHSALYEMEKTFHNLDQKFRPLMRALALEGKKPKDFDRIIGIIQDGNNAANALLKLVPKKG